MGNMERAPEPTMEEILASIRRIIADDETTPGRQRPAPERQPDPEITGQPADNQIIDDIARVLSGSGQGEQDDDILDLTKELGLSPVQETPPAQEPEPDPVLEMLSDADFEPDAPIAQAEPEASFEAQPQEPAPSANDEATSALEQAIAALRAGRLHSQPAEPEAELVLTEFAQVELVIEEPTPAEDMFAETPSAEAAYADMTATEEAAAEEAAEEPAPRELSFEELVAESHTFEADSGQSWSSDLSNWGAESEPEAEVDFVAARMARGVNGSKPQPQPFAADAIGSTGQTLEDSVKEMLRPMLRQWLDENMSRVLTAALREELRDGGMGRPGG